MDTTTTQQKKNKEIYNDNEAHAAWAMSEIETINKALELREQSSIVFNGLPYSISYEYNRRKAINYAPPKDPQDDAEVSFGIIHEKIIAFAAIYLKYVYKRHTKVYDENGQLMKGLGDVYDLSIEHSYRLENFKNLIAFIYWEAFTQGNAFILEDWEVLNCYDVKPKLDGNEVTADQMDYSYEFLDTLTYEEGELYQKRRAVSRLLDGRSVIFDNPEIVDVQDQPGITIEEEITRAEAEKIYGTLKQWKNVPSSREEINAICPEKTTLFNAARLADPAKRCIIHRRMSKLHNTFNIAVNGVWVLPQKTPMSVFYPRMNYPISNVPGERLTGSIYCRSIPAKTKFNADFIDWALKGLAYKFEQGKTPAILTNGRYTLNKDMFRGGQVTHGVKKSDYEKADPDNKGVTNNDVSFVQLMKGIVETQTTSVLGAGDLSGNPTAEEIATLDQNQKEKLGYLLDGLVNGFTEMYMRRSETIESKYTIKQKETVVDGETVNVYQNFTVNVNGVNHVVSFDDRLDVPEFNQQASDDKLFEKSFNAKKAGDPTEFYLVNPRILREGKTFVDVEVTADRKKDAALEMVSLFNEFGSLLKIFGQRVDMNELQKEYLQTSNRPESIFLSPEAVQAMQQPQPTEMGPDGQPIAPKVPMKQITNQMQGR